MRKEPEPLQVYKHFKGTYYQVLCVAAHSETGEKLVIYRPLFGGYETFARPLEMFLSEVDHDKYPDVKQKYRFALATGQVSAKDAHSGTSDEPGQTDEADKTNETDQTDETDQRDDFLDRFMDAESFEEKLDIFTDMWKTIDENNIDNVATIMDITLESETLEEKYKEILSCLKTRAKYECSRLR